MASCKDCLHVEVCYKATNRKAYTGNLKIEPCKHFKSKADVPDINDISTKIAEALVKAEIDCTSICKDFGGGCYWSCKEKVENIKQWVLGVIENDT